MQDEYNRPTEEQPAGVEEGALSQQEEAAPEGTQGANPEPQPSWEEPGIAGERPEGCNQPAGAEPYPWGSMPPGYPPAGMWTGGAPGYQGYQAGYQPGPYQQGWPSPAGGVQPPIGPPYPPPTVYAPAPPYQAPQPGGMQPGFGSPSQPPKPPKKKMDTGTKVFLWVLGALCGLFILGFCGYGIYAAVTGSGLTQAPQGNSSSQVEPPASSGGESSPEGEQSDPGSSPGINGIDPDAPGLPVQPKPEGEELSAKEIYQKVSPSVVGVVCYEKEGGLEAQKLGEGSGVILTENGYIMTNSHVVNHSREYPIRVVLSTGEEYAAVVVGYDSRTDIAVLKIEETGLPVAALGDSGAVEVGEWVLAIGNPGGLNFSNSLTRGIVSAVDRMVGDTLESGSSYVKYIQTDTAINPGNSGGALVNMYGQVVGIPSNKIVISGYEGMGFAIPMNTAKAVADDLIRLGYVSGRVKLGMSGTVVSAYLAEQNQVPQGVMIASIDAGSDLANKGVQVGDIITAVEGKAITAFDDIYIALNDKQPGDEVTLSVTRPGQGFTGNTEFEATVVLLEDTGS